MNPLCYFTKRTKSKELKKTKAVNELIYVENQFNKTYKQKLKKIKWR